MKLVDSEKVLKEIEKMSLKEKQKQILDIQKKGFKYDDKEIKEIIKDKWVFLQSGSDTDIVEIDYVLLDWQEAEELRIEQEQAESGDTVISRYFKKHGAISYKQQPKDGSLHNQILYFDGKACPGGLWNTELFMYRLHVYKSNAPSYSQGSSYIQFSADMYEEDLIDAKMIKGEPNVRHCHDWHTNPHKKNESHYKYENWLEDIQKAKSLFVDQVKKYLKGYETLQYNSRADIYFVPGTIVFWFEEEADHNGDDVRFCTSDIYSKNKYKGSGFRNNTFTVPAKFDKTVNVGEIIEKAEQFCEDKLNRHNFRQEFKY